MNRHLPLFILQIVGISICLAVVVYYFLTGEANLDITGLGFSLATLGTVPRLVSSVYEDLLRQRTESEPPGPALSGPAAARPEDHSWDDIGELP